jgi:hypothetical protein
MKQDSSAAASPRVDLEIFAEAAFEAVGASDTRRHTHYIGEIGGTTWGVISSSPIFGRILERALGTGIRPIPDPPSSDHFRIYCIDGEGGEALARPPHFNAPKQISPDPIRRIWLSNNIRIGHQVREDILTVVDLHHRRALVQVPKAEKLPYHEQAAPMRSLFQWLMASNRRSLIHGAVIGTKAGGVLLIGRGGSGKSSTALVGLGAGLHFAGDDYVVVETDGTPCAYGLYATAKVERKDLDLYTQLDAELHNPTGPPEEKAVLFLNREPPGFRAGLRLRAIVLPRITRDPMHLRPCSPAQALQALAPSTLLQMGGDRRQLFEDCTRLVRRLPAFILHTGPRTQNFGQDVARSIGQLVDRIASSG